MNIAFPAILLFLVLLPGFIFRLAYTRKERTNIDYKPFTTESLLSVFFAAFFHCLGLFVVQNFIHIKIDYQVILALIIAPRNELLKTAIQTTAESFSPIFWYFTCIYICAWLSGYLGQKFIFYFQIDRKLEFLKFDTPWYYTFKGLVDEAENAGLIKVAATISLSEGTFLYEEVLKEFYLTEFGELDRIILTSASRRLITKDKNVDSEIDNRFYPISGSLLILKYSDMSSLNIEYYTIEES